MKSRVRASAVVIHQEKILTFRAVDPHSGQEYFFLPGGEVEPHETAPEAAERETFEETGFKVTIDPDSVEDREYVFSWNNENYNCLTLFYRGQLKSPMQTPVKDADYNKGVVWIPLSELKAAMGYSEPIYSAILQLLER